MTRRLIPGILALLLISGLLVWGCARKPEARVTNLILIVVDTLRSDHVGCYGYPYATPVIDGLASNGTLFEQAITPVPVTDPAFASLLTSTYPPTHGFRDNGLFTLSPEMVTLAEILDEEGFRTAAFLGSAVMDSAYGLGQGFRVYDDHFEGRYIPNRAEYQPLAEELRTTRRRADVVTQNALSWIKRNRRSRFFVMLHYFDPHSYYDPPPPFDLLYAENLYDGEIAFTDFQIGNLLRGLATFEIPGQTMVVLTADHGEGLMDHEEAQHGLLIYDTTLRVPLIFTCPEVCPPGLRIPSQVSLVDIGPTVLTLLGVETPESFQGTDLSRAFSGEPAPEVREVYCETYRPRLTYGWSHLQGIRTGAWKYIRAPKPELYDLIQDRREITNLSGTGLSIEETLASRLDELVESFPTSGQFRAAHVPRDEGTRERLASLGYLAGMGASGPAKDEDLPNPKDQMEVFNRRQLASHRARAGWALLESGDHRAALEALGEAVQIEPESPLRYVNLAAAYARLEKYGEATAAFHEALLLNPEYVDAHLGMARMYKLRGDVPAAIEAYRQALDAEPNHEEALSELVQLHTEQGRPAAAVPVLESILRDNPDNPRVLYLMVETLRQVGDDETAVPYLEQLTRLQPLNPDPPFFLAYALTRLGREDEALRWYRRTVELDPGMVDAYYNIACIHSRQNRKDEAFEWLEKAVEQGFDDFSFMRRDPDLEPLGSDPRFRKILQGQNQ